MRVLIFLILILTLFSCANTGLKVINGLAKSQHYRSFNDIEYAKYPHNKLNLYLPKEKAIIATIIFYYGGCWGHCSQYNKDDYLFVADTLTHYGYAVVIPDYRKFPAVQFPEILSDAKQSTLWVLNHLHGYGIKNDNIFIMGHSAGAHIGALLVADENKLKENLFKINGFIGLAGPYDFYPFNAQYMYELFSPENDYHNSQPINFINGNEPPHLILQGKNDNRVFPHNAINLAKKLKENDINNQLVIYEKMSHAKILLNFSKPLRKNSKVLESVKQFIAANLSRH